MGVIMDFWFLLFYVVECCLMLFYVVLCCFMLFYVVLCCMSLSLLNDGSSKHFLTITPPLYRFAIIVQMPLLF